MPITMREDYPGAYPSEEYRFLLKGEEDHEVPLLPFTICIMETEGALNMGEAYSGSLKMRCFRKDGFLTVYDCQKINPYGVASRYPNELIADETIVKALVKRVQKVYDFCATKVNGNFRPSLLVRL